MALLSNGNTPLSFTPMYKRIINKLIQQLEVRSIPTKEKVVYLTFDDGPEEGILDFVLSELDKYNYKATFFCRGDNAERNPHFLEMLRQKGHSIGNHTYSHLNAFCTPAATYAADAERADAILHTPLFRASYGRLTVGTWLKLRKKYRFIYWTLNSGDSDLERYDHQQALSNLKTKTRNGDIILFHFCQRHEQETRRLLPEYLEWLHDNGYKSLAIRP